MSQIFSRNSYDACKQHEFEQYSNEKVFHIELKKWRSFAYLCCAVHYRANFLEIAPQTNGEIVRNAPLIILFLQVENESIQIPIENLQMINLINFWTS